MSSNDTDFINNKKNNNLQKNENNVGHNIKTFLITILTLIILFMLYFMSSALVLFGCKLGQSNILPTEVNCMPYDTTEIEIQPVISNIFQTNQTSQKLQFPYNKENSKNIILDILRKYKTKPDTHFLTNYFISIIQDIICFVYSSYNVFFNSLNSLPESAIIVLGPIASIIYSVIIFILSNIYFVYSWFINMAWFFKSNTNNTGKGKPEWSNVTFFEPYNYGISIALVVLFCILFWIIAPLTLLFLPLFIVVWCIFSILSYKGILNNTKKINSMHIILETIKHYKLLITSAISLIVVLSAFTSLGNIAGLFSIITILLIYYDFINLDIYKPNVVNSELFTQIVSDDQAQKICKNISGLSDPDIYSFIKNLMVPQQKGGKINKL